MKKFDVAVIGGGPGGYVAAIRLNQYKINTVVFERERIGGVCLNHGCVPTKSLVKVAEVYDEFQSSKKFGISVENISLDYQKVWQRKNEIVEQLVSGVEFIFQKRKIPVQKETVNKISKEDEHFLIHTEDQVYQAKILIIATGSSWKELPNIKTDNENVLSSRSILQMQKLPKKLVVIGGGVIGCEFASIYHRMGVKVEIVEFLPALLNNEDKEVSRRLQMAMKRTGIKIHLKTSVQRWQKIKDGIQLELSNGKKLTTEKVLLSVGRKPIFDIKTENFNLIFDREAILIDDQMRTNMQNIYAIGDVTAKSMLAHTASKQAILACDDIYRKLKEKQIETVHLDYHNIPNCTFTKPEIGSIGLTEDQAKKIYQKILVGKFPFAANGKALGMSDTFGFVKTVINAETKEILGAQIIGPQATELIAQIAALMGSKAKLDDIKKIVFAHPTLSETIMEAFEDAENLAIHKL